MLLDEAKKAVSASIVIDSPRGVKLRLNIATSDTFGEPSGTPGVSFVSGSKKPETSIRRLYARRLQKD